MNRFTFKRQALVDIIDQLPSPCTASDYRYGNHADLLITMLGFEDRCGKACEFLANEGWSVERCLVGQYAAVIPENQRNHGKLSQVLNELCRTVAWSDRGADSLLSDLERVLREADPTGPFQVVLDISVMTSSIILGLIRLIFKYPRVRLLVLYVRAEVYGVEKGEFDSEPVPRSGRSGVNEVHYSVDFPGTTQPGLSDLIIVVPVLDEGFRMEAAIDYVNPTYSTDPSRNVCWIIGESDREEGRMMTKELLRIKDPGVSVCARVDDKSIKEYMRALEEVYEKERFCKNVTVVHFGTKLQTLGLALFCLMRPSVRVLSVEAATYDPDLYSHGAEDVQAIDFGTIGVLARALDSVDTIVLG